MKIRNKKTGEIVDLSEGFIKDTYNGEFIQIKPVAISNKEGYLYGSLAELNEDWEDYKPAEPLIKDEKIRKAVRAFSEAIQEKKHILVIKECGRGRAEFSNGANYWIRLPLDVETMDALEDRTYYTIAELCGEEENDTSEQKD